MTVPALLLALLAQSAPPAGAPPDTRNEILEGVAVQAGESLITLSDFVRTAKRMREQNPPENAAQEEEQRRQVLRDLAVIRLEEQGGGDLGLDPAQIERISRAKLEEQRDRAGLDAYLAELESQGKDVLTEESDRQGEIRRYLWELRATGRGFAGQRPTRDQSIRPGELWAIYEENKDKLDPPRVQLRWLIISSESMGSAEAARASCEDARQRVLAGEDLALIVEERGAEFRDTRGLTPALPARGFRDPDLAAFAETAEVGALTPVLPLRDPRTGEPEPRLGYQLALLHDRQQPPVPEFGVPSVQKTLREYFTAQRRERILGRAREGLYRDSYTWVNPLLAPTGGGAAARQR